MSVSRRGLVQQGLLGCALCAAGVPALARVLETKLDPIVLPGYKPADLDERGLWQECNRLEEALKASNLLIKDPALNDYVRGVVQRLLGDASKDLRIYIVRNPEFNASMAPNGMMLVHSGLLARMRNEAQLAAVLGHEAGHYLRKHSVQNWRSVKTKSTVMTMVSIGSAAATRASASPQSNWYNVANVFNTAMLLSLYSFSRELESEADAYGLKLLDEARYDPKAASQVWKQLLEERKASAAARKKAMSDPSGSSFSTHPPSSDRMRDLAESAAAIERLDHSTSQRSDRKEEWLAGTGHVRALLLEEQVVLNDAGASLYLVNALAQDGWDGTLRFYEGEAYRLRGTPGDDARAAEAYKAAVIFPDAPPEAFRAKGYALLKTGEAEDGKAALSRYLYLHPDAADASMVRFSLAQ